MANPVDENFGSKANTVIAPTGSQAQDNPMHVYGSGDSFGSQDLPKGAEIMRKRAEEGTMSPTADNSPANE